MADQIYWDDLPQEARIEARYHPCVWFEEHHTADGAVHYECVDCHWQTTAMQEVTDG